MPVAEYPEIAPPTIVVRAIYPGANAETIAATVATPLEQEINGVESMLYMSSYSTERRPDGADRHLQARHRSRHAQVLVQNRVAIATPRLPEEVRRLGVTTRKCSPDLMMVVHMLSPDESYDQLYVSNYARNNVRDVLLRLDGVGDLIMFGERQYSLRVWLDPEKLAAYGLTAGDVVRGRPGAERPGLGRRARPAAGPADNAFQFIVTTQGRFDDPRQFREIIVRSSADGRLVRLRDVARVELGAQDYVTNSYLNGKPAVAMGIFQRPGTNALDAASRDHRHDGRPEERFSDGPRLHDRLQSHRVHRGVGERGLQDAVRGGAPRRPRRRRLPAELARRRSSRSSRSRSR